MLTSLDGVMFDKFIDGAGVTILEPATNWKSPYPFRQVDDKHGALVQNVGGFVRFAGMLTRLDPNSGSNSRQATPVSFFNSAPSSRGAASAGPLANGNEGIKLMASRPQEEVRYVPHGLACNVHVRGWCRERRPNE